MACLQVCISMAKGDDAVCNHMVPGPHSAPLDARRMPRIETNTSLVTGRSGPGEATTVARAAPPPAPASPPLARGDCVAAGACPPAGVLEEEEEVKDVRWAEIIEVDLVAGPRPR